MRTRACAYQEFKNLSFWENFAKYVVPNGIIPVQK